VDVILDPAVDMTDSMGRFTAGILAQVAQLERELIGKRTKEALQAARERGVVLGRPLVGRRIGKRTDRRGAGVGTELPSHRRWTEPRRDSYRSRRCTLVRLDGPGRSQWALALARVST
jgi:hypothetical protein